MEIIMTGSMKALMSFLECMGNSHINRDATREAMIAILRSRQ